MNRPILMLGAALVAAVVGSLTTLVLAPMGANSSNEDVGALRARVDELAHELAALRAQPAALPAATAAAATPEREREVPRAASREPAAAHGAAPASAGGLDRDAVFALIKEERELREREKLEKQRKVVEASLAASVKGAAEKLGLDPTTADALTRLYLEHLGRQAEIRRAYPAEDEAFAEKRRLELDAANRDLLARANALVPSHQQQDWARASRWFQSYASMLEPPSETATLKTMSGNSITTLNLSKGALESAFLESLTKEKVKAVSK